MRRAYLTLIILMLVIGFAAVTTNLIANGNIKIGFNQKQFEDGIIFTYVDTATGEASISEDAKTITFTSSKLENINQEAKLEYDVANKSLQYDAKVTVNCKFDTGYESYDAWLSLENSLSTPFNLGAGETNTGILTVNLDKAYNESLETDVNIKCELVVSPEERIDKKEYEPTRKYKEDILHGADPVLDEDGELIPVTINNGIVTKTDVKKEWYKYKEKEWANAVILTNEGVDKNFKAGDTIDEKYIESYFVWIPKYRYKLFDDKMGIYTTTTQVEEKGPTTVIEIEFGLEDTINDDTSNEEYKQCATPMLIENGKKVQGLSGESGECNFGEWMTHPAFLAFNTNGLWVGKFSTSYKGATSASDAVKYEMNKSKVQIKPNMYIWRGIQTKDAFENSYEYKRDLDSHMMKNTEWGAVAYLTQSLYGRCTNSNSSITCSEITINKTTNYMSGYTETTEYFNNSIGASTTGNYNGIYDMSGPSGTRVMGIMKNSNNSLMFGSSQLTTTILKESKYYDVYQYGTNSMNWNRRILGDATGEIGPFQVNTSDQYISSMWGDLGMFLTTTYPLIARGGAYEYEQKAGVFTFATNDGTKNTGATFRIVLAPQ